MNRITLCNCLCSFCSFSSRFSASCIRNTGASRIRDFDHTRNVKIHLFLHKFLIRSEIGFGHIEEQLKRQARVVLRKKLCLILCSALQKLYKLLTLLITIFLSVYLSICLFTLSIYLFNYTPGGRSLLPRSTLPGRRLLLKMGN